MVQIFDPHIGDVRVAGLKVGNPTNPNGTIDGMPIGQTTPVPGSFTTLSASGAITNNGTPIIADGGNTIAGGTTAAPTPITQPVSNVTTADSTHIAVILPTGVAGMQQFVYNSGGAVSETVSIYCQSTDTIDGGSAGGNVTLTAAHRAATFYCVKANTWISALIGAVST